MRRASPFPCQPRQDAQPMRFPSLAGLGLTVALALLSTGCCGPFACGPGACAGPFGLLGPGCESGCGERYIDPWINEPPAGCDPCDACGNYNGQSCGTCRPVFSGTASLWGYRYDGGCGDAACDGGCDSCGGGCDGCGMPQDDCGCGGGHAHAGMPIGGVPTPAGETIIYGEPMIHDATIMEGETVTRSGRSDARQIFQPRKTMTRSRPARAY